MTIEFTWAERPSVKQKSKTNQNSSFKCCVPRDMDGGIRPRLRKYKFYKLKHLIPSNICVYLFTVTLL